MPRLAGLAVGDDGKRQRLGSRPAAEVPAPRAVVSKQSRPDFERHFCFSSSGKKRRDLGLHLENDAAALLHLIATEVAARNMVPHRLPMPSTMMFP